LLLDLLEDLLLVTINATPIIITKVAIIVDKVITSLNIIHPRITAITGTIYANEFATDADSTRRSQKNSA
jgi:hypothetical protein